MKFIPIIMAGGSGQRFWPLSTSQKPKQFLDLEGKGRSLLQATFDRLLPLTHTGEMLIVTVAAYLELVQEQLPDFPTENIIIEPVARDTTAAIALAALEVEQRFGNVMMGVFTSDHQVKQVSRFHEAIREAMQLTETYRGLTTIGIKPSYPATGFGYIQTLEPASPGFKVARFVEKPNEATAKSYLASGDYYWNNGIFMWYADSILWELSKYAPEVILKLREAFEQDNLNEVFPLLPKVSIDYAVLEKSERVYVLPADYGWDDLGDWGALERLHDSDGLNTVVGKHIDFEASGNIIYTTHEDDVIVTLGVKNLVIVKRDNTVLIAVKERVQDIKQLLTDERLSEMSLD